MLKAILFDMDDTLIDWGDFLGEWEELETPHLEKLHVYLSDLLDEPPTFEKYKETYLRLARTAWSDARSTLAAPHLGRILVQAASHLGITNDLLDMDACMDAYGWGMLPGINTFPDVIDGLKLLRDNGLRFGLVTNAFQPMRLRDLELESYELLEFFPDCRISAADVGKLKPHPEIFEKALECMGTTPDETVFIGDNPTADIAGAQSAGMRAILRVTPRRKPLLSGVIIPDAAINDFSELPAIFDDWFPGWNEQATKEAREEETESSTKES